MIKLSITINEEEIDKLDIRSNGSDDGGATQLEVDFALAIRAAINAGIEGEAMKHKNVTMAQSSKPPVIDRIPGR